MYKQKNHSEPTLFKLCKTYPMLLKSLPMPVFGSVTLDKLYQVKVNTYDIIVCPAVYSRHSRLQQQNPSANSSHVTV